MQLRFFLSTMALSTWALGACIALTSAQESIAHAQSAPATAPDAPAAAPDAPAAQPGAAAPLPPMPPVDPANFTATSPTKETVDAFFKQSWGYDPNRIWQVQAIQKTQVQGVSRVVVVVEEKGAAQQQQPSSLSFFVLPDGKHLITDELLPFGAHPFEDYRHTLQQGANGPSKGASSKDLEFVEFADFQCPHCKDAQPTVERLLSDFPNAHYVYENFPLSQIHPEAMKSSEYSVCVAKLGDNDAFFKFSSALYGNQAGLTPEGSAETLKNAVTAAGQDPAKIAACASTPEARSTVEAQRQLGIDVGVNSTPTIFINGRALPFAGIPYDTLKQIIRYQAQLDGVGVTTPNARK